MRNKNHSYPNSSCFSKVNQTQQNVYVSHFLVLIKANRNLNDHTQGGGRVLPGIIEVKSKENYHKNKKSSFVMHLCCADQVKTKRSNISISVYDLYFTVYTWQIHGYPTCVSEKKITTFSVAFTVHCTVKTHILQSESKATMNLCVFANGYTQSMQ